MNIGQNLLEWVQENAAGFAAVFVIIFGIRFWLSKETGKFIGAAIILAVCIMFMIEPSTIITFATGVMKRIISGGKG